MRNKIVQAVEAEQMKKDLPVFKIGDTVSVETIVTEGERQRLQKYEGIIIAKRNRGLASSITVRKNSYNEDVEKIFPLHSPLIKNIDIKRHGDVRKAKLYYLRDLHGKAARVQEKLDNNKKKVISSAVEAPVAVSAVAETTSQES